MRRGVLISALLFALGSMAPLFIAHGQAPQARWMYPELPKASAREISISNTQEIEQLRNEVSDLKSQLDGDSSRSLANIAVRTATVEVLLKEEVQARRDEWATQQKIFFGLAGGFLMIIVERIIPLFTRKRKE